MPRVLFVHLQFYVLCTLRIPPTSDTFEVCVAAVNRRTSWVHRRSLMRLTNELYFFLWKISNISSKKVNRRIASDDDNKNNTSDFFFFCSFFVKTLTRAAVLFHSLPHNIQSRFTRGREVQKKKHVRLIYNPDGSFRMTGVVCGDMTYKRFAR